MAVASLPLARFVFKQLDFGFASGVWSAGATVELPTFDLQKHTLGATVQIANGSLRDLALTRATSTSRLVKACS